MLLTVAASASCSSHHLPSPPITNGGAGVAPRAGAAKFRALTTPLQRSSSFNFGCACSSAPTPGDKDRDRDLFDEYSVLSADIPWESEDIWRTFAGYLLILHIPLSFGGLDAVAKVLRCSSLDPLTTVVSTAMLQLGELTLGLALLQYTAKPHHQVWPFFFRKFSSRPSWIKETVLWFGLLVSMVFVTSLISDRLIGPEDAYDPILKEILSDSPTSRLVCFFLYCVIAPLSEETIYRGFLLTSLSTSMKWKNALIAQASERKVESPARDAWGRFFSKEKGMPKSKNEGSSRDSERDTDFEGFSSCRPVKLASLDETPLQHENNGLKYYSLSRRLCNRKQQKRNIATDYVHLTCSGDTTSNFNSSKLMNPKKHGKRSARTRGKNSTLWAGVRVTDTAAAYSLLQSNLTPQKGKAKNVQFQPTVFSGLNLHTGAQDFDLSSAKSALAALYGESKRDLSVEFAVKLLMDEIRLPKEAAEVENFFKRKMNSEKKHNSRTFRDSAKLQTS